MTRPAYPIAAAVLAAWLAGGEARADATLTMNVAMPRTSSFYLGLYGPWKDAVERESQGHIKIEIPAATLAPLNRQWDMVTSGIADVGMTPNDFIRQRVKLPFLAETPFIAPNSVAATVALWRTQQKFFNAAHEYKGVKLLGMWVNGGNVVTTISKPVASLDDFKGLKLWVATPNMKKAVDAFGGTAVPSEGNGTMFDYVSAGITDGAVTGKGSLISFQLARYVHHITTFSGQLGYNTFSFFMNQKAYDKLSPADKAVIDKVSYESISRTAAQGFVDQDDRSADLVKQYNIEVSAASPQFVAAAAARIPFYKDDFLASAKERGIDGAAAYDYYVKTANEVAAAGK